MRLPTLQPPTRDAWQAALGADSTQLRIQVHDAPREWIAAYSPRWEAGGILAQRRSWPPDTLHVAWESIRRVDTRVTGSPGLGMTVGGIIGGGIAVGIGAAAALSGDEWAWIAVPIIGLFTVPVGIIVGGSLGQKPHWEPVYCSEHD